MIIVDIPGGPELRLRRLVADFNGTLAEDGVLVPGVAERLEGLSGDLDILVVTADTFGAARRQLAGLPVAVEVLAGADHAQQKADHVRRIDPAGTVAVGNGRNDQLMLAAAGLGFAVVLGEGAAVATVGAADVVFHDVRDALDALLDPRRLVATLRS
jgi:soluble P-type ATPase